MYNIWKGDSAHEGLQRSQRCDGVLGIDRCRRGQLKPIGKILKGKDVLLIAATCFGKSMVYQIPAVCWPDRLMLVVEPLMALMHDQVKSLQSRGI